jgi:hypothetical protein
VSNVFAEQRELIAGALSAAGVRAHTTVPARWTPPGAFVGPGDPYITREGANFGCEVVRHRVTLVISAGTNETQADDLDNMIVKALDALYALEDFDTGDVRRPRKVAVNGQAYPGVFVDLLAEVNR